MQDLKLGEVLKKYRHKHKLSAINFARKINITKGYYSVIEHNKVIPFSYEIINNIVLITKNDKEIYNEIIDFYKNYKILELNKFLSVFNEKIKEVKYYV